MMKPVVIAKDVFNAAVARVQEAGIPTYRRQHVGHGIGVKHHDLPVLMPLEETPLEANMTFEVETPYYRLGVGGAFIEDTAPVTETGSEILTTLSRELERHRAPLSFTQRQLTGGSWMEFGVRVPNCTEGMAYPFRFTDHEGIAADRGRGRGARLRLGHGQRPLQHHALRAGDVLRSHRASTSHS